MLDDKQLTAKSCPGAFRTGRRGGSGAVLNGKADVLLADKKLSAKSCSGAFRISRRGGPGAVLSRKNDVLLADKDLSSKSWSGWCGAFRTGRRTHTCARTCAHMHKHDSNAARRSDDETNWNPIGARRFSGVGGRGRSPSKCASLVMEVWGTRVAVYPGAECWLSAWFPAWFPVCWFPAWFQA